MAGRIATGYTVWSRDSQRAASKKLEFGNWWRLDATFWQVTWLEATGELYAVEGKPSDRYIVLCRLEKKEVIQVMKNWFDGNELGGLFRRFEVDLVRS
jgi:hypothetical protein